MHKFLPESQNTRGICDFSIEGIKLHRAIRVVHGSNLLSFGSPLLRPVRDIPMNAKVKTKKGQEIRRT